MTNPLYNIATNSFRIDHPRGRPGSETRPHSVDDEGVKRPTRKEFCDASIYHTPAPPSNQSPPDPSGTQPDLGLDGALPKATIQRILTEEGGTRRLILSTPWVTFWTFFWRVLNPDRSCRSALKWLGA